MKTDVIAPKLSPSDWNIPKLLIHIRHEFVVLSNGKYDGFAFSGTIIRCPSDFKRVGEFSDKWDTDKFVLFSGKITLSND